MKEQIWHDNTDKFRLAVGKDTRHFIFFIVQVNKRFCNNLLIFKSQGVRLLKYLEMVVLEKFVYSAISLKVTFFLDLIVTYQNLFLTKSYISC